ncbi:Competence protein A [Anatilimnocola aggregata]|uniref:Competence protein A n=1 Tax=Anatilimnocola aggregata TaxID=2528021 RepID=A0A517YJJ6_9BACT|nr:pilus assembly protein PilM [Anatilimnocola aggregata]QDU30394.1 Competence protein A [Anatilimnocola aggregata]
MARSAGVWGIDVGRCALKALRCRMDGDVVVADGYDYIEYPKLLTQADADAAQLVKEALEQFLSRNNLRGDRVAISVPGESGLARYFKPPPVDVKKIADIVKYEARQQIPFALEDVIWDYQRMPGGQEVDGFALESEVGLFAMKREQVAKALKPFLDAEIEVDVIQLAPIAIYNFFAHDMTNPLKDGQTYDSDSPPASSVVLSIGTETTDLVVTNGFRLWQRNIPLGGNHFTKQLSKDLKLTFAKAEHLKRNPRQAEDPKAIFQAMRPVFGDMVTEVQRSIGFFHSLDRKAKITNIVILGNTVKLPGLSQYLGKHLGYEVTELDAFRRLTGASVVTSPSFKDNLLAFGAAYGLCVQALEKSKLKTNLLPRELILQRIIKAKKPWAVAGVAAIVLACALNFIFHYMTWEKVHELHEENNVKWADAVSTASNISSLSGSYQAEHENRKKILAQMRAIGDEVVGAADRRVMWLEITKAINNALPPMAKQGRIPAGQIPDHQQLPFSQRQDLKIEYLETQHFPDLAVWFTDTVKRRYIEQNDLLPKLVADPNAQPAQPGQPAPAPMVGMDGAMAGGAGTASATDVSSIQIESPTGPGWVIEIKGYHFFNDPSNSAIGGSAHVKRTLIKSIETGVVDLPSGPGGKTERFTFKELGLGFAILARDIPIDKQFRLANPNYAGAGIGAGGPGLGFDSPPTGQLVPEDPKNPQFFTVPKCEFVVQFCWQEKPLNKRFEERKKKADAAQAAAAAGTPIPGAPVSAVPVPGVAPAAVPVAPINPAPIPVAPAVPPVVAPMPAPVDPGAAVPVAPSPAVPEPAAGPGAVPATPPATPPPVPPA